MKRKVTKAEFDALQTGVQNSYSQDGDGYVLQIEDEESPNEELARLRKANVEVTAKAKERKAKMEELESNVTSLQTRLKETEDAAHDALIGVPLRKMAATLSPVPDIWLSEFQKYFKLEADPKHGNLQVLTLDGKAVMDRSNNVVEFTPHGLWNLLASDAVVAGGTKDARSQRFAALMHYFGGNGGASVSARASASTRKDDEITARVSFGLR